jgi:hypothetical protein
MGECRKIPYILNLVFGGSGKQLYAPAALP